MEKIVVQASARQNLVILVISAAFVLAAAYGLKSFEFSQKAYYAVMALLGVFTVGGLYGAANLALGLPKITADRKGVRLQSLFQNKFWTWDACGRFYLSTMVVKVRYNTRKQYFACAFSRRNQQAIDAGGAPIRPDFMHADIKIPLGGTRASASETEALVFVERLNEMLSAQTAHTPQTGADLQGPARADVLRDLERARRKQRAGYIAATIFVILFGIGAIGLRVLT